MNAGVASTRTGKRVEEAVLVILEGVGLSAGDIEFS
jgi:hypothetical protein